MELKNLNTVVQHQKLSQGQIQSLEILEMDSQELNQVLQNEYLENPLLEYDDTNNPLKESLCKKYENMRVSNKTYEQIIEEDDKRKNDIPDRKSEDIETYLLSQINLKKYNNEEITVIKYIIACLEENGFLKVSIDAICNHTKLKRTNVHSIMEMLKNLEPYGIFAYDLRECLLKQLEIKKMKDTNVWKIVDNYLDFVALGKYSVISRNLKISTADVRKCIDFISKLNSRPKIEISNDNNSYIFPDIIITKENGILKAELNDTWINSYSINDYYVSMMEKATDDELKNYFKIKLDRIKFINLSIEKRQKTLIDICNEIIKNQKNFLLGTQALNPMTMNNISDSLGINKSTVSRAIKGKYVQYPNGTKLMKDLFCNKISNIDNDVSLSSLQIKAKIKDLINKEDKKRPLSDNTLSKLLAKENVSISRRTVAKYREELKIKDSYARKI